MNEKQLAKLIKKTTAKAAAKIATPATTRKYDPALQNRPDDDNAGEERTRFFKEMKRREF